MSFYCVPVICLPIFLKTTRNELGSYAKKLVDDMTFIKFGCTLNCSFSFIANPYETLVSLRGIFCASPHGKSLKPVFEDISTKDEASGNYANDFLHMTYKPVVEGELQV